jgi:hypothetical protein
MDPNPSSPIRAEFDMLMPILADTMKFASQALSQSVALAEVLIEKGILTKAELDAAMQKAPPLTKRLMEALDEQIRKQN